MITLEQAREIVATNRGPQYAPEADFEVAYWGWENDDLYLIRAGSYAELHGPRDAADLEHFYTDSGPVITVNKHTGEYLEHYGLDGGFPDEDMVPFGNHPA